MPRPRPPARRAFRPRRSGPRLITTTRSACCGLGQPVRDDERGPAREHPVGGRLEHPRAGAAGLGRGLVEHGDRRVGQRQPRQRDLLRLRRGERRAAGPDDRVEPRGQRARPSRARRRARAPPRARASSAPGAASRRSAESGPANTCTSWVTSATARRVAAVPAARAARRRSRRRRPPARGSPPAPWRASSCPRRTRPRARRARPARARGRRRGGRPGRRRRRGGSRARRSPRRPGGAGAGGSGSAGGSIVATPTSRASAASARWASSTVPSTTLNWSNRRTNSSAPAVAPPIVSASARTSRKPADEHRRGAGELGGVQPREEPGRDPDRPHRGRHARRRSLRRRAAARRPPARARGSCGRRRRPRAAPARGRRPRPARRRTPAAHAAGTSAARAPAPAPSTAPRARAGVDRRQPDERQRDRHARAPASAGQRLDDRLRDRRDVVADAREEVAAARAFEPLGRQPERAVDDPLAQLGEHRLPDRGDERDADGGERGLGDDDGEQGGRGQVDRRRSAAVGHPLDDLAEQQRPAQAGGRRRDEHEPGDRGQPAARAQQLAHDGADLAVRPRSAGAHPRRRSRHRRRTESRPGGAHPSTAAR